jgi:hypothetical protein
MQENIRSYKRLEEEANVLQVKIAQLEQIMADTPLFCMQNRMNRFMLI